MKARDNQKQQSTRLEYVVVGAGPAAICAVAKLYGAGVSGDQILWIDPHFTVGDFGTILSEGSSVPGNTTVESYQRVNRAISELIPACAPTEEELSSFEITHLGPEITCSLKIAAVPLQHLTTKLRKLVSSILGSVLNVEHTDDGLTLQIAINHGAIKTVLAKRVILAVGATPKSFSLGENVTLIDPNTAFIASKAKEYLQTQPAIKTIAVIGSSHSAALAVMHFLQAGVTVKQFMNKDYKFATRCVTPEGQHYTIFDNTGLKGEVATFTRELLQARATGGALAENWRCYVGQDSQALLAKHLSDCSHAVVCIGYSTRPSLTINDQPLSAFNYDYKTSQMQYPDGHAIPGVFGIGVAFPKQIQAISGELEFAVGVGKFWTSLSEDILHQWRAYPAKIPA
jgi:hypothetical protein